MSRFIGPSVASRGLTRPEEPHRTGEEAGRVARWKIQILQ